MVGPRRDGEMVVAANGRLWLLSRGGDVREFAPTYHSNPGLEAYVALASPAHPRLQLRRGHRVRDQLRQAPRCRVDYPRRSGAAVRLDRRAGLIDGIAFDETGTFGSRLLVVTTRGRRSTVDAINCHGAVRQVTASAHRVEGGIAVAPMSFGRFAGDLIASDELGGGIWAVTPTGHNLLVAASGLPHGPDTGVESEAFVPAGRFYATAR